MLIKHLFIGNNYDLIALLSLNSSSSKGKNGSKNMKRLDTRMTYNGDDYLMIKRSENVALYSVNDGRHYEVTRIYISPKHYDSYWFHHYPEREVISSNGQQYNTDGSKCFFKLEDALWYFERLNRKLENHDEDNNDIKAD